MKWFLMILMFLLPGYVFAQEAVASSDFLAQVLEAVKGMGGLSGAAKVSTIVMLLISSMKVSALAKYWDKLGTAKPWASPLLGVLIGLASLWSGGAAPTLAQLGAYMLAGAGALHLHELLDLAKKLPKVGPVYIKLIDLIEGVLSNIGVGKS